MPLALVVALVRLARPELPASRVPPALPVPLVVLVALVLRVHRV